MAAPKHGGRRVGAGRPLGTGRYGGEPTRVMRIPDSMVPTTLKQLKEHASRRRLPAHASGSPQRFRSNVMPAAGLRFLGQDTYLFDVPNDDLKPAGISCGDQVVVDGSRAAVNGDVVLSWQAADGLTIKRLRMSRGARYLESDQRTRPIDCAAGDVIWGVVTGVVRPMCD